MTTHTFTFGDHSVTISDTQLRELYKEVAADNREIAAHNDKERELLADIIENHKKALEEAIVELNKPVPWWRWESMDHVRRLSWRVHNRERDLQLATGEVLHESLPYKANATIETVVYNKYIK